MPAQIATRLRPTVARKARMKSTFLDRALGAGIPYITYAVPVFFLMIALELALSWRTHRRWYRLNDTINDLSCGITEQLAGVFLKGVFFLGYLACYELVTNRHWNLVDVPSYSPAGKWVAAIVLFLGVDLAYYWFHRIAHEYNAPWAGHVVHHSSEEYNLAVALRQGALQGAFSWVFYLPLGLLGFPPAWFVALSSFDTLYQFWIHTRAIDKLGPLEWIFNTPSHHRVHHARNPGYLDKNYAGTLIIWDRLFGTFVEETETPVYGLTKPLNSWNPLWAQFHIWYELSRDAWLAPRWSDKLRIWVMPQGWRPPTLPPNPPAPQVTPATVIPYDAHASRRANSYVVAQFAVALVVAVAVMVLARRTSSRMTLAPATLVVVWSLVNFGGLFERKQWVTWSECVRLLALVGLVVSVSWPGGSAAWIVAATVVWGLASGARLLQFRGELDDTPPVPSRVVEPLAAPPSFRTVATNLQATT